MLVWCDMKDQPEKKKEGETKPEEVVQSSAAKREHEVLKFWNEHDIFKKTLTKDAPLGNFVFYDGPPFATGLPHYGHILPGTIKDVIPRYQTMKGKRVLRRWGWDCHGLPVEQLVSKELGLHTKKDIEQYGVEKFNEAARASVLRYFNEWKEIVPRSGRFIDMDNFYQTMDATYTESVWWAFKQLFDKGLVYEGFKTMHVSPYYETTLSNFEVNQGYKDITDISAYVKFKSKFKGREVLILAWTTTPWTLPGNVALAVNNEIQYVLVEAESDKGKEYFILAKELVAKVFGEKQIAIVEEFSGKELVGLSYAPLFDYYKDTPLKNKENGWKVYAGEFVTATDGTGIVHIAPAFGEDDLQLAQEKNLPFIQHVGMDGAIKPEVTDFAGLQAKPADDVQKTDIEVIKYLAHNGSLFKKEKFIHSYPHDYRTGVPLLNYATSSWFVRVADMRDGLMNSNSKVSWLPEQIGEGRFGKWLEGARDWSVSRARFWGTPLPIWKTEDGNEVEVLGSLKELKDKTRRNTYMVMRHAESENNVANIISSELVSKYSLTANGRGQVKEAAQSLKDQGIDLIVASSILRTHETATLIAEELGLNKEQVIFDERLHEIGVGEYEGRTIEEYVKNHQAHESTFTESISGGESYHDLRMRLGDFIYEFDKTYHGKKVLIVTHASCVWMLSCISDGLNAKQCTERKTEMNAKASAIGVKTAEIGNASVLPLDIAAIPHNMTYELDFHRPYIDRVTFMSKSGKLMKRIPDVFDTWFDSGSMTFAQNHYPFENKEEFEKEGSSLFPADFIAEGLDQTRGWFYVLTVLGTALFGKSPYKNVVVNGMILAEDGRKMSKSLRNYPDLLPTMEKYSADALRFYLMSSPAVHAEDIRFSEKGIDEVMKKIINRTDNVLQFVEMYSDEEVKNSLTLTKPTVTNLLDTWALLRIEQMTKEVTESLDGFELDRATRPIVSFVDDLSTWYIRRSRERFKGDDIEDKKIALQTSFYILAEFSKVIAPFMPFFAESLYMRLTALAPKIAKDFKESVHLDSWPALTTFNAEQELLIKQMTEVREIVSLGLEARAKAVIKVRQPLRSLSIRKDAYDIGSEQDLLDLIKDEVNVKEVIVEANFDDDDTRNVKLDLEITEDLRKEGDVRELIRAIQEARKTKGLNPTDTISLHIKAPLELSTIIAEYEDMIKKVTLTSQIDIHDSLEGVATKVGEYEAVIAIS